MNCDSSHILNRLKKILCKCYSLKIVEPAPAVLLAKNLTGLEIRGPKTPIRRPLIIHFGDKARNTLEKQH